MSTNRLKFRQDLLLKILEQPSAPFRETHVIRVTTQTLKENRIPHFVDPVGNIVVGAKNKKDYIKLIQQKTKEPVRVFIAHTDHPGFHGDKWISNNKLKIKWHGGSPTQHLKNSKVWLADQKGYLDGAKILQAKLIPSGKGIDSGVLLIRNKFLRNKHSNPKDIFGGFGFRKPCWISKQLIYTKAADDLVGVFAIVSLAIDFKNKKAPFLGLLTRAEEVGFIGAIGHFNLGWLGRARRKVICVSLETSRTLAGAYIGKGPVVRLGDRATVFDPSPLRVFIDVAQKVLPGKHQKRIMDGGTCEATAATAFGFSSIGISIPLGNYHNQSFEGGPDSRGKLGPAPEFVHLSDVKGLLILCHALLKKNLPWNKPWDLKKKELARLYQKYRDLL
jgi:endoglucanase